MVKTYSLSLVTCVITFLGLISSFLLLLLLFFLLALNTETCFALIDTKLDATDPSVSYLSFAFDIACRDALVYGF